MNFILAFILLATISMVNAIPHQLLKRDPTQFIECPISPPVPLLSVGITPDPVVAGAAETFVISGVLKQDVTSDDVVIVGFGDPTIGKPIGEPTVVAACDTNCPIKAGSQFSKTVELTAPGTLPTPYLIGVGVGDQTGKTILGCAYAVVGAPPKSVAFSPESLF